MTALGLIVCALLLCMALVHAGWAFGMRWPAENETMLIRTVVGHPDMTTMPGTGLTLVVAASIGMAGLCALWLGGALALPLPDWIGTLAGSVLALVFASRGLATYFGILVGAGPLSRRVEPFATLDRRLYAPLCLLLSLGFVVLTLVQPLAIE